MFTRYLTLISAFILILLIIRNLLTRQQQRSIDTATKQIAKILLITSLIAATYTLIKD
ncbi:protein MIGRI [Kingella oralis]|uniref:protein MIGRI n=1 Tax=Kingella oralis TaxID=505 RepID=UPI0034E4CA26